MLARKPRRGWADENEMGHSLGLTFLSSAETAETEEKETRLIQDRHIFEADNEPDLSPPGT